MNQSTVFSIVMQNKIMHQNLPHKMRKNIVNNWLSKEQSELKVKNLVIRNENLKFFGTRNLSIHILLSILKAVYNRNNYMDNLRI